MVFREGEERYTNGAAPSKYTYTGQYSYADDFGLMFYNARWYDPYLGRFAQADSVVPGGVQGYDRYAYANNNPVSYNDPSGHCALVEEDSDGLCVLTGWKENYDAHDYYARKNEKLLPFVPIQVVHGGTVFPNQVEVALANAILTGDNKWLDGLVASREVGNSLIAVAAKIGYNTGYGTMDPSIVLLAGIIDPGGVGDDDDYVYASSSENAEASSERGLDGILSGNDTSVLRWVRHKFPAGKPFSAEEATKIWTRLRQAGVSPVLDPPHSSGAWQGPHINVRGTSIHIPVDQGFVPPP